MAVEAASLGLPRPATPSSQLTSSLKRHLHSVGYLLLFGHGAEVRQTGSAKVLLPNGHFQQSIV